MYFSQHLFAKLLPVYVFSEAMILQEPVHHGRGQGNWPGARQGTTVPNSDPDCT